MSMMKLTAEEIPSLWEFLLNLYSFRGTQIIVLPCITSSFVMSDTIVKLTAEEIPTLWEFLLILQGYLNLVLTLYFHLGYFTCDCFSPTSLYLKGHLLQLLMSDQLTFE